MNAAERSVRAAGKETGAPPAAGSAQRPAAIVGNEMITWAELNAPLGEAAGAIVLEEVFLDRLLSRELQRRALTLEAGAAEREEGLLVETLALTAGVPAGEQGDLIQQLRRTRGLGEQRYSAMLRRNAMLRRLVKDEVQVSPEDLRQAFEMRYGERYQTRLMLFRTEREAADAMARVRAGEGFADVASAASVDPSALRGGFIGGISPADPAYPVSLRRAIATSTPGTPSGVVALEQGYAIVLVEQVLPASGADFDRVSASLEREVRLVRERGAMDRLAAQLLRASEVTVLDPSLNWSWQSREQTGQ